MSAYYNEFDPYAAQWLRNLIAAGQIAPGDVDERSIVDVAADDLVGYRQCHFFAGIGGWALAARLAGWPDDRELWTGSPPCQPFSVAGKQEGFDDSRDLWPVFAALIRERRPATVMGEQVSAAIAKHWLDRMRTDLEAAGYAVGASVQPACAVDGPHRRDRLWIVAEQDGAVGDSFRPRLEGHAGHDCDAAGWAKPGGSVAEAGCGGAVADRAGDGREQGVAAAEAARHRRVATAESGAGGSGLMADARRYGDRCEIQTADHGEQEANRPADWTCGCGDARHSACNGVPGDADSILEAAQRGMATQHKPEPCGVRSSGTESAWGRHAWIIGHDGKARRVGTRIRRVVDGLPAGMAGLRAGDDAAQGEVEVIPLLAHGVPARVGKLRAFGNAIVPQVAAEVIAAYMECRP